MSSRPRRHISPEKNLTMAQRLQLVTDQRKRIDAFDRERERSAGQLTPRGRIAALVDEGSFLELGAFAKSQHHEAAEAPADGVITGYAEIDGRRVAVLAEDPLALARTDAQVGRNKRNRLLSNAIYRRLPVIYLADGAVAEPPSFDMHRGILLSRVAEQLPARDIAERAAPVVAIVFGLCSGPSSDLAVRSDLLLATPQARFGTVAGTSEGIADAACEDDASAIAAARRFLALVPKRLDAPLEPLTSAPPAALDTLGDEDMDAGAVEQAAAILDAGSAVLLSPPDAACIAGIGQVGGFPVAFALTGAVSGGRTALTTADMKRIARTAQWSADYQLPFLSTQNTLGYDPADASTGAFIQAAAHTVESLRASQAAKITIITGWGYALGDFALGGLGTGFDFVWCWPSARIGVSDDVGYVARVAERPLSEGPWEAAELGLVSEMITPADSRDWLIRALRLIGPGRALPAAHYDRGQQIHDMT